MNDHEHEVLPATADRVVAPPRALPAVATQLDPDPRVRPGEMRLSLDLLQLAPGGETAIARTSGGDVTRMRAGLLEATTERGGLPRGLDASVLLGRVDEVGWDGSPLQAGDRVAVVPPVGGLACWLHDVSAWNGGRIIPVRGHVMVPGGGQLVRVADGWDPRLAAELARAAAGSGAIAEVASDRIVVIGAGTTAGAHLSHLAAHAGYAVVAVVAGLPEARVLTELDADQVIVATTRDPATAVNDIATQLGDATATIVLATDEPGAVDVAAGLASLLRASVATLEPEQVPELVRRTSGTGYSPRVVSGRTLSVASTEIADVRSVPVRLQELAAWRAGVAGPPAAPDREDP